MNIKDHLPLNYFEELKKDVRFVEGLTGCISCGTCTAICPAAEFYNYDPRMIVETLQTRDNQKIYDLLTSDVIWYCGECMSCKTRCPRKNAPGLLIMACRALATRTGLFTKSEKGRQQLAIKRSVGHWILKYGYCVYREELTMEDHPEQGPTWEWQNKHLEPLYEKFGAEYKGEGAGPMRNIPQQALDELKSIFDITGGTEFYNIIEEESEKNAKELGLKFDDSMDCEYMNRIFNYDSGKHVKQ